VPTTFFVNDFSFNNDSVVLTVSYNNGTFLCPNTAADAITYNSIYDMYCEDDSLVRVLTPMAFHGFGFLNGLGAALCKLSNGMAHNLALNSRKNHLLTKEQANNKR
jgi:hypothetical protein